MRCSFQSFCKKHQYPSNIFLGSDFDQEICELFFFIG
jgi:hypothetical protein